MYTFFLPEKKKGRFTVYFNEAVLVHVLLILLGTEWFRMFVREFHLNVLLARNKLEWIFWIHPLRKYTPVQFHSIAVCRQLKAITTLETEEHLRIHYIPFSRFSSSTKFLEKEEEEHKNTPAIVSPRRELLPFDLHTRSEAPLWHQRILYIFRQLHAVINWRPLFRRIVPRRHCSVIDTARGGRFSSHFTQCNFIMG